MRLDYHDYTKLLKAELNARRADHSLPLLLAKPTSANVRNECATVYKDRNQTRIDPALRAFFGSAEPGRQFEQLIHNFPIDKFKPIVKYLKGELKETDVKNVELLAWLLDFRHRPYMLGKDVSLTDNELALLGGNLYEQRKPESNGNLMTDGLVDGELNDLHASSVNLIQTFNKAPVDNPTENTAPSKIRSLRIAVVLFLIVLCICSTVIYLSTRSVPTALPIATIFGSECMYWSDDHYQKIPCDQKMPGTAVIQLDTVKLNSFKKIMREDTITAYSIGKIYYVRLNGKKEYYTAGGQHPIDAKRELQILSKYMYDKYLKK